MRGLTGSQLLGLPVRLHGIELGRPVDLLLDHEGRRVVGIELVCGDQAHRFLPLAAASVADDQVVVDSAFTVIDDASFYRKRGRTLATLRGVPVEHAGAVVGTFSDVVVGAHGAVDELVLDGERRLPFDDATVLGLSPLGRTAA
jgi:uncharacterized protein YrrD